MIRTQDVDGCHITYDVIRALVGTPFGDRLERLGLFEGANPTMLEPEALIAAMGGFPRLRTLAIPHGVGNPYGPVFYGALARNSNGRPAGTGLKHLTIRDLDCTDGAVAHACRMEGLEELVLDGIDATSCVEINQCIGRIR